MAEPHPSDSSVLAWARLIKAQQAIVAAVERDLKAEGFPPLEWYDVLLELDRAPHGALRPFELEGTLLLAQYNLSRLLERMSQAGYVEKSRCPNDGRGQVMRITEAGRSLRSRMWPAYAAAIERHLGSQLEAGDAASLAEILGRLVDPACLRRSCAGGTQEEAGASIAAPSADGEGERRRA